MNWPKIIADTIIGIVNVGIYYLLAWAWTDGDLSSDLFTVGAILVLILSPRTEG